MLNGCGHGIAHSQIEEINRALCLKKVALTPTDVPLPEHIQPYIMTTLAWDNIDRLEETLSGSGTSYRVNGITVEARHFGASLPPLIWNCASKGKEKKHLSFSKLSRPSL